MTRRHDMTCLVGRWGDVVASSRVRVFCRHGFRVVARWSAYLVDCHVVVGAIFRTVCFLAICGVCFGCWLYFVSNVCVREFSFVLFCAGHLFGTLHSFVVDALPGCCALIFVGWCLLFPECLGARWSKEHCIVLCLEHECLSHE